jgi:hypothetical protein
MSVESTKRVLSFASGVRVTQKSVAASWGSKSPDSVSGYAQGLVIALLASFLVLVAPFGADKALAADPSRIIFNNGTCELTAAGYSGEGSELNPFVISDSDSLWEIADCDTVDASASAAAHFSISNDIDVSQAASASTASPIGYSTSGDISFSAVLNGNNHMISNISMSSTTYGVGLFAYLHSATISNLVISGSFVTTTGVTYGTTHSAGALAMYSNGDLQLSSVSNQADVTGVGSVGGLVGWSDGSVNLVDCRNTGTISAADRRVGGLVGFLNYSNSRANVTIKSSFNTGTISAVGNIAGGLVGEVRGDANISSSYNVGQLDGSDQTGGLVGDVGGDANVNFSYNTGPVSGTDDQIGGLVGYVDEDANITSSYNTGQVSGDDEVGGLVGYVEEYANINLSYNTGPVLASDDYAGGMVGYVHSDDFNITSSYNSGPVSGDRAIGGLIGYGEGSIYSSFNFGAISGGDDIGGLIADAGTTTISNAYNTGAITATGTDIGGLIGEGGSSIFIENSYNTGVMSVTGDYSGLVGPGYAFTATSVYTDQVASSSGLTSYSPTALADMKELTLYSGWDFDAIWGFGACSDNNGLPMLREFAQVGTYFGFSCGLDAAPARNPVASTPAVYEGPTSYQLNTEIVPRETSVVLTGNNMDLVTAVRAGSVALEIQEQTATSLKLFVGQRVALGSATLYLTAINGTVYRLNAFTVIEGETTSALAATKKVNAGSFKGYVALYALGYEGQRLSAKVGKDWVIVPSIPAATNNLFRQVEFTGAGVDCTVRIYIDRVLVRTVYLTTK